MVFENPTFKSKPETKCSKPDDRLSNITLDSVEVQDRLFTTSDLFKNGKKVTFDIEVKTVRYSVSVVGVVLVYYDHKWMKVK